MKRGASISANAAKKRDQRRIYNPNPDVLASVNAALAGRPVYRHATGSASQVNPSASQPAPTHVSSSSSSHCSSHMIEPTATFSTSRPLAPSVANPGKASVRDALAVTISAEAKSIALAEFEVGKLANSSRATQSSQWSTYQRLHSAWYDSSVPVLPLTPGKIAAVASMFKAGRYASYANFVSVAKAHHIAKHDVHGVAWSDELAVAVKDATRSVQRGLGNPRQSQPLDVHRVHSLRLGADPVSEWGPISPGHFAVLGVFFLTREVEIACAAARDIHLNESQEEVTWHLPVSKSDQKALGTSRTWGCVCAGDLTLACPFHSAVSHLAQLRSLSAALELSFDELPLFPDKGGSEISRFAAVQTIIALARMTGDKTHDNAGRCLFGGHSLRTGGASALTGLGLDGLKIECLARWHSPMIAHYARLAPLKSLTDEYRLRAQRLDKENKTELLSSKMSLLQAAVDSMSTRLDELSVREMNSTFPDALGSLFVRNCVSNVWHESAAHNASDGSGTTRCGWDYTPHASDSVADLCHKIGYRYCNRCLPKMSHKYNRRHNKDSSATESSE